MSRDLTGAMMGAVEQPVVRPFFGVHIDLPDPVRAWTGIGTIIFDGETWIGAGGIGSLDAIGEATDGSATGIKCTLAQVPSEFRDDLEAQAEKGATFEIYVGALNETFQQVEAFKLIWKGRLDTYTITDGGDSITVEVTGESRAIDQRRPAIKRFTNEYQQRQHTGDKFFEYVPQMSEVPILWAKAEQSGAGVSSGGGGGVSRVINQVIAMR